MRLGTFYLDIVGLAVVVALLTGCGSLPTTPNRDQTEDRTANQTWHDHHQQGWTAIQRQDFTAAEQHLLAALAIAEHFDSCDRRLAETLDDLGLVYFSLNNDHQAELMQGRAVGELLLAKGFRDPDLPTYATRLGYIFARQDRRDDLPPLDRQPYRILELGYLLENLRLAKRIDALIYEYERVDDQEAVDYLSRWVTTARQERPTRMNEDSTRPTDLIP